MAIVNVNWSRDTWRPYDLIEDACWRNTCHVPDHDHSGDGYVWLVGNPAIHEDEDDEVSWAPSRASGGVLVGVALSLVYWPILIFAAIAAALLVGR
jgi:hypothetical protein